MAVVAEADLEVGLGTTGSSLSSTTVPTTLPISLRRPAA